MTTDDKLLDVAFAAARRPNVVPSDAVMDRIMMDADSILAQAVPMSDPAQNRPKQGFGSMLLEAIGGWPSLSGLAAATVAGLWIGVAPPSALSDISAGLFGTTIEVPLLESDIFAGLEGET